MIREKTKQTSWILSSKVTIRRYVEVWLALTQRSQGGWRSQSGGARRRCWWGGRRSGSNTGRSASTGNAPVRASFWFRPPGVYPKPEKFSIYWLCGLLSSRSGPSLWLTWMDGGRKARVDAGPMVTCAPTPLSILINPFIPSLVPARYCLSRFIWPSSHSSILWEAVCRK